MTTVSYNTDRKYLSSKMGGPRRKVGGPEKIFFRRFAPELGPPTFNLLATPLQ